MKHSRNGFCDNHARIFFHHMIVRIGIRIVNIIKNDVGIQIIDFLSIVNQQI